MRVHRRRHPELHRSAERVVPQHAPARAPSGCRGLCDRPRQRGVPRRRLNTRRPTALVLTLVFGVGSLGSGLHDAVDDEVRRAGGHVLATLYGTLTARSSSDMPRQMNGAAFVLIPGAGGMAWVWHRLVPLLERAGHAANAVDLPATTRLPACATTRIALSKSSEDDTTSYLSRSRSGPSLRRSFVLLHRLPCSSSSMR
jgi:hypothetical protein